MIKNHFVRNDNFFIHHDYKLNYKSPEFKAAVKNSRNTNH